MKSKQNIISPLILLVMLILPVMAMVKLSQSINLIYIIGYFSIISVVTIIAYNLDKKQAEANAWRIRESTLHFYEFIGGWGAAFCAQRLFRHKISKEEYQFKFWFIGVIHQCIAFDYILNWRFLKMLFQYITEMLEK